MFYPHKRNIRWRWTTVAAIYSESSRLHYKFLVLSSCEEYLVNVDCSCSEWIWAARGACIIAITSSLFTFRPPRWYPVKAEQAGGAIYWGSHRDWMHCRNVKFRINAIRRNLSLALTGNEGDDFLHLFCSHKRVSGEVGLVWQPGAEMYSKSHPLHYLFLLLPTPIPVLALWQCQVYLLPKEKSESLRVIALLRC